MPQAAAVPGVKITPETMAQYATGGSTNKLAKLRRHASGVHFAKIHFG